VDENTANPIRTQVGENVPGPLPGAAAEAVQPLSGETVRLLAEQLRPVLHAETEALREELRRGAGRYRTSARLYGAAAAAGLYGAGALTACLILALAHGVAAWLAALIIAIVLIGTALFLSDRARQATPSGARGTKHFGQRSHAQ
jgi:hypothetical protein